VQFDWMHAVFCTRFLGEMVSTDKQRSHTAK
jgi:hypothetical protein